MIRFSYANNDNDETIVGYKPTVFLAFIIYTKFCIRSGGLQVRIPVQVSGILTSVRESAQRPSLGESHTSFLLEVSPQPASNEITLRYKLEYDADVRFDVYDIRGQHCGSVECGQQQRGQQSIFLSTRTLAQGTYLVRYTLSGSCCGQGLAPRMGTALVNIVKY
jgi:hypothetical protein